MRARCTGKSDSNSDHVDAEKREKGDTWIRAVSEKRTEAGRSAKKELAGDTAYRAVREMVFANRFTPGGRINVEGLTRAVREQDALMGSNTPPRTGGHPHKGPQPGYLYEEKPP
jgi:hypothetical protein